MVIVDQNVTEKQRPLVEAFVDYVWSREAQEVLVDFGFRSVLEELSGSGARGAIPDAFTLADLGGARAARQQILDAVWRDEVLPRLER